jgi:AcrR family transcriptional regulator
LAAQHHSHESRGYTLRARQDSIDQTRLHITEATMRLHEKVGPAATTVSAIADLAGVTRPTVYRHFPDEESIVRACSGHWRALHPRPDSTTWSSIDDPMQRLRTALSQTYTWAHDAAPMMTKIYRDLHLMPTFVGESLSHEQQSGVAILSKGFLARGRRAQRLRASLNHALDFRTWHSLCVLGELREDEAIELMLATVSAAVRMTPSGRPTRG